MSPTDKSKSAGGKASGKPGNRRRGRRPATIDLAATEVSVEPAEADAPESSATKKGATQAADEAEQSVTTESEEVSADIPEAAADGPEGPGEAPAKPGRSRGFGLAIFVLGAVLGGLVALGAYGGLVRFGLLPGTGQDLTPIEARIDALGNNLDSEIAALKASGPEDALAKLAEDAQSLTKRLEAAEEAVAQAARRAAEDTSMQRIAALEENVGKLAARIENAEAAAQAGREEVRALIERLAGSNDSQTATAAIAALVERINAVEVSAKALSEVDVAAAKEVLRLEMDRRVGAALNEVVSLRADVAGLRKALASSASGAPAARTAAALAVAMSGLERAVNSGAGFERDLATVEALAGPRDEITSLKAYASGGVARRDELADGFESAASAAMSADAPAADGVLERLISNARRVVRIRPTGEVEGETTGAILARSEARLNAGDLAGAVDEAATLEPAAGAAIASWLERARARLAVERLVAALNVLVLTGLSPGEGTNKQ